MAGSVVVVLLLLSAGPLRAEDAAPARQAALENGYKGGEIWPLRLFEGADLLEPAVPLVAWSRGDGGRIVLDTVLPFSMLVSSLSFRGEDRDTRVEIGRWSWLALDEKQDNYPTLYGLCVVAGLSTLLPSPEDGDGYSWNLRLDRATVFVLGMATASLEEVTLKPLFHRKRPNGNGWSSRPSGHALSSFAAAAFLADVLRDTFRPQDESRLFVRLLEEVGCALPYLGAFYVSLERVHGSKHYLTDVLLGGALGSLTMHLFYAWSFTRIEQGRGWIDTASIGYDPDRKGFTFALVKTF